MGLQPCTLWPGDLSFYICYSTLLYKSNDQLCGYSYHIYGKPSSSGRWGCIRFSASSLRIDTFSRYEVMDSLSCWNSPMLLMEGFVTMLVANCNVR